MFLNSDGTVVAISNGVGLLPLLVVLNRLSLSRSTWLSGVKKGIYPAPVRLSPRRIAWRPADIQSFIDRLESLREVQS